MIKTNIKMRVTPEKSVKVQKICFENGIDWMSGKRNVQLIDEPFLFIDEYISFMSGEEDEDFLKEENEEIDPELFIRTNGSCIEKEEFIYPMWFKHKNWGYVVKFTNLRCGIVVTEGINPRIDKDFSCSFFTAHTDNSAWEQVENPNNNNSEIDNSINNGGKTDYYQLKNAPFPINDFDDFAEWRGLNGSQFNMGKAMWTFNTGRHSGTNYERDLNKIIHYANRELLRLKRGEK